MFHPSMILIQLFNWALVTLEVGIYSYTFDFDTFKSVILESVKIKSVGVDAH